jgi:hypothetical protein
MSDNTPEFDYSSPKREATKKRYAEIKKQVFAIINEFNLDGVEITTSKILRLMPGVNDRALIHYFLREWESEQSVNTDDYFEGLSEEVLKVLKKEFTNISSKITYSAEKKNALAFKERDETLKELEKVTAELSATQERLFQMSEEVSRQKEINTSLVKELDSESVIKEENIKEINSLQQRIIDKENNHTATIKAMEDQHKKHQALIKNEFQVTYDKLSASHEKALAKERGLIKEAVQQRDTVQNELALQKTLLDKAINDHKKQIEKQKQTNDKALKDAIDNEISEHQEVLKKVLSSQKKELKETLKKADAKHNNALEKSLKENNIAHNISLEKASKKHAEEQEHLQKMLENVNNEQTENSSLFEDEASYIAAYGEAKDQIYELSKKITKQTDELAEANKIIDKLAKKNKT